MAITEEDKQTLKQTERDLKNQTMFFPIVAIVLGLLIIISVYFYHTVEKWSLINSLYFVVVTMATVGYGDYTPTTNLAKVYTIFLIIFGIATFTTFITQLLKRQGLKQIQNQLSKNGNFLREDIKKIRKNFNTKK